MIVHNVEQGSREWLECRLGIPTASAFKKIITPTGKLSAQARQYAYLLCAERLLNGVQGSLDGMAWMERGKELEAEAVKSYEFEQDVSTKTVGFITTDCGQIGCSPDRLVGDRGLLEIKCPAPSTHVGYLLDGMDKDYIPQVQGQLFVVNHKWCSELKVFAPLEKKVREWCDWYSYNPAMPSVRVRVFPDAEYQANMAAALSDFVKMKLEFMDRLQNLGRFGASEYVSTPVDRELSDVPLGGG